MAPKGANQINMSKLNKRLQTKFGDHTSISSIEEDV
jgi:hypothetical protein